MSTTSSSSTSPRERRALGVARFGRWVIPWLACTACTTSAAQVLPAHVPAAVLHRGPLSDYVSAAGLRWLILLQPEQLLKDPELGPAIRQIVPEKRLDAFAEASGVELRRVTTAAVAGFPYTTLYLAELPEGAAELARSRFSDRLVGGARLKRSHPALLRISGVVGQTPETMVTIDERVVSVAVGDPTPAKIVEAYAMQRLKNSPSALLGASLSTLPSPSPSPAVLLAPGPFADEWQRAAGGLLRTATALAITARPIGHGKLAACVYLSGPWDDSAADAKERLGSAWTNFAHSSAGHLFGLNDAAELSASPTLLTLSVEIDIATLIAGLRASVLGDVSEILSFPRNQRSTN